MAEEYVVVKPENEELMELPTSPSDNSLALVTLDHAIPGAYGLKYKNPTTGASRVLRMDSTGANFLKPPGGWAEKVFSVIFRDKKDTTPNKQVNDWTVISEYVKHFAYFTVRKDRNLVRVEDGVVEPVKKIEGGMCTAIASHYLVTYYHGTHKQFQIDEKYWICQTINLGRVIPVTVVSIKKNKDFVILHTEVELTHYSLFHGNVNGGVQFLTLGLSDRTEEGSHLSHRMGMIISGEMHAKNTVRAAVAVDGGDSGAPVVNNHYEFLGMVVSTVECKYGSDPLQDAAIHTADTNILPCGIIESALEEVRVKRGEIEASTERLRSESASRGKRTKSSEKEATDGEIDNLSLEALAQLIDLLNWTKRTNVDSII